MADATNAVAVDAADVAVDVTGSSAAAAASIAASPTAAAAASAGSDAQSDVKTAAPSNPSAADGASTAAPAAAAAAAASRGAVALVSDVDELKSKVTIDEFHKPDDYFRIEKWYDDIKSVTFPTHFAVLTHAEARIICAYRDFQRLFLFANDQKARDADPLHRGGVTNWDADAYAAADAAVKPGLKPDEVALLDGLTRKLDALIQPLVASCGGAFVRLSTRSPKDAALVIPAMTQYLTDGIRASTLKPGSPEAEVEDMVLFTRACGAVLRVKSGAEAVALLLHSQRAYDDLSRAELLSGAEAFEMKVIVRGWVDIAPEWEFRCWVYGGQMTAATQYYDYTFVPGMADRKADLERVMRQCWAQVKDKIRVKDYTIDFAVSPDLKQCWIVELNHLPPIAGTGLFLWDNPHDRATIQSGPYELRVHTSLPPLSKRGIHNPLRRLMRSLRGLPDNESQFFSHQSVSCDGCHVQPITKLWYRCNACRNYDLCTDCRPKAVHFPSHYLQPFISVDCTDEEKARFEAQVAPPPPTVKPAAAAGAGAGAGSKATTRSPQPSCWSGCVVS